MTKRAEMPTRFVSNEVVTNRAGNARFFPLTCISVHVTLCFPLMCVCVYVCVCVCVCVCVRTWVRACVRQRERFD